MFTPKHCCNASWEHIQRSWVHWFSLRSHWDGVPKEGLVWVHDGTGNKNDGQSDYLHAQVSSRPSTKSFGQRRLKNNSLVTMSVWMVRVLWDENNVAAAAATTAAEGEDCHGFDQALLSAFLVILCLCVNVCMGTHLGLKCATCVWSNMCEYISQGMRELE